MARGIEIALEIRKNKNALDSDLKILSGIKELIPEVSAIRLTNNEIKHIVKVTNSIENTGILLKETSKKITSQKRGLLISSAL